MYKEKTVLGNITLVGLSTRTSLKNEMNPETAKIGKMATTYWSEQIANQFKHRVSPGITYSVYTDYESDEYGEYTYFIGEAVKSMDDQDIEKFDHLYIPPSHYQKFTTEAGKMPEVVIAAWQDIWRMTPADLGGNRRYIADFEVYDQRATNPNQTIIDIYIGIVEK